MSNPTLTAQISALGAELVVLRDEEERDLLWNGDPAFWTGRSPLLFPIVGRVRGDRIRVEGVEYALPPHGFAHTSLFEAVEAGETSCRLGSARIPRPGRDTPSTSGWRWPIAWKRPP